MIRFVIVMIALQVAPVSAETAFVYISASAARFGDPASIQLSMLDLETGALSEPAVLPETKSTRFLAISADGTKLYAIGTPIHANFGANTAAIAYAIDPATGGLTFLNETSTLDGQATHVSATPDGKALLTANFGGGSVTVIPLLADGRVGTANPVIKHTDSPSGVVAAEQTSAQAHWHAAGPNPAFSYVPDRGIDKVVIYALDTAAPSLARVGEVASSPGAGPRHMCFHPNGRWAYVVGELMMKLIHMDLDLSTGMLTVRHEYSTLADGAPITLGTDKASEVAMHPTGKWVYVANRGRDTITVFAIDPADGSLTTVEREDTRVTVPRHFGMDPTGRYIIAGGQNSHDMTLFTIDLETGALDYTGTEYDIGSPICFVFAGVDVPPRNAVDLALWQHQE